MYLNQVIWLAFGCMESAKTEVQELRRTNAETTEW